MFEKFSLYLKTHRKFLVGTSAAFLFFCFLVIGPLFVEAMVTLTAQRNAAILQKNSDIEAAILNNDYATWSGLVSDTNLKSKITADNFSQFTNAYRLLQQGKVEEANIVKKQLALKQDFATAAVKSRAIETAIDSNNYEAWRTAVGSDIEPVVNSGNFATYVTAYKLIRQGNMWDANVIKRTIGAKPTLTQLYDQSSSR